MQDAAGNPNDIAIVGMALRVPGARSIGEFWRNLRDGVEAIRTLSPDDLRTAGERPEKIARKNYVPRTAELPGMEMFDPEFFGLSPKDAAVMDPQHRQFLECAWEAMEDAARPPSRMTGPVGVFAGCGMGSYFYFNVCSHRALVDQTGMFLLRHTGNDKDFLATRASFAFDLKGPSVNIQTACSTSLVAVHYACQSLLAGECDMALAGGVTIELPHRRGYLYEDGEILSPDGHCRAFDHRAAGTVFGSGVGVVVLRRLADALADGDPIHAVIKATAVNNDGAGKAGYLAPSVTGQAAAIVEALGLAGTPAESIQYVECHGTGTYLGDPIEIAALTQAYRQETDRVGFCRVGSVKTNIGHLDTAAGVVGLIKAALALKHAEIPPTLNFEKPNPSIPFAESPFVVADRLTPWPATRGPRRAAINSLGVGGTNAHAILEQAPVRAESAVRPEHPYLLALSAKTPKALDDAGRRLAEALAADARLAVPDVAHTLMTGRQKFEATRVVAVRDRADAIAVLRDPQSRRHFTHEGLEAVSGVTFLFPGGGAQYPGMARALYAEVPVFRASVDEGLSYLAKEAAAEVRAAWLGGAPDAAERFLRPSVQLPAILIVEVAMARLWMSRGVVPTALIGHSMGENAAACVAGVLSFERAVNLVRLRGELFEEVPPGGMLSVALPVDELVRRLPADVDIASINAPGLSVVSGPNAALEAFQKALAADDIDATRIPIDIAAHSRMLDPILARFETFLRATPLAPAGIPIVSNRTGRWLTAEEVTDPLYWVQHLRSTVKFADGIATLAADPARLYVEVGPGRALSSLVKAQSSVPANQVIHSLPHAEETTDDHLHFLTALGRVWAAGLDVDLGDLTGGPDARRLGGLPTYPFQHKHYFLERIAPTVDTEADALPRIEDMTNWGWRPTWKRSVADVRPDAERGSRRWLVFRDDGEVGRRLVARLEKLGHDVVVVEPGDAFARRGERRFTLCPEHGREGYDALIQHLVQNGGLPDRIVHLGLLTHDTAFRPGSSFLDRVLENGFYSLLHLGQAIADAGAPTGLQITVVTNGMQRVGDEPLAHPEKATVLGPALVLPREIPEIRVRTIDVALTRSASGVKHVLAKVAGSAGEGDVVETIWEDLFAEPQTEEVAWREGRRWTRVHDRVALDGAGEPGLRQGGVYLVTGGLGDLGGLFARELAARFKAKIVLLGRLGLPDRAHWATYLANYGDGDRIGRAIATIEAIEAAGGEVHYAAADVSNPEAVRAAVQSAKARFGRIDGVLHAAGLIRDGLIAMKSAADIQEVLGPKVLGTMVLAEALADEPLDVVVLFSSTSSDTAPAGQVDYVAANAYLNAFAESRAGRPGPKVVAVHWGIWQGLGLAARAIGGQAGRASATLVGEAAPLLDRLVVDEQGRDWFEVRVDAGGTWVLGEHGLATGEAIWPGTGYIELIAEAARERGIPRPFAVEDLTFLRPLYVPQGEARTVRITFEARRGGWDAVVESEVDTLKGRALLRHAEARVRAVRKTAAGRCDLASIEARCTRRRIDAGGAPMAAAQAVHLAFGPRWQVLRSFALGEGEAIARLALEPALRADLTQGFLLHPALLDIATGYAMDLIPGYDPARGLWVPMTYGQIVIHAPLTDDIRSHVRLVPSPHGAGYATFDVTITDADGHLLLDISQFTIKQLDQSGDFRSHLGDTSSAILVAGPGSDGEQTSPALKRLAAQIERGIRPEEGLDALTRALATGLPQVIVSSMDLEGLRREAGRVDAAPEAKSGFDRPDLESAYVAPRTPAEERLAAFWSELLGVSRVGVDDNFFDLGGHSLIAVRLFRMIRNEFAVDFPISILFEAPTIAQCAVMIEKAGGKAKAGGAAETSETGAAAPVEGPRNIHVVPLHPGARPDATPFFIAAGMFGNVLNLRHLANQIGRDRPVYGLQARGLYGDQAPHETFEEMARSYLAEIRQVQPTGPYLLGGFSGGGLVAYEMAQQLRAAGEEVGAVVMLDTPFPETVHLSLVDRLTMKMQDFSRTGPRYLLDWLRDRIAWELGRRARGRIAEVAPEQFHNQAIEAAFRRALSAYRASRYDGTVHLLRPRLAVAYRLRDGRHLNAERSPLHADNGWTPWISKLEVIEVPGNHDSMVLEPNVRVLTQHVRRVLREGEQGLQVFAMAAE